MMEAAWTTETLVNVNQTRRCCNPDGSHVHFHRLEGSKSQRHFYYLLLYKF